MRLRTLAGATAAMAWPCGPMINYKGDLVVAPGAVTWGTGMGAGPAAQRDNAHERIEAMRIVPRTLCAGLAAAIVLSLAAGSGFATRLSLGELRWTAIWEEMEPFVIGEPEGFGTPVRCALTLGGSLHARTITKVSGRLIGYVNRAVLGSVCTGGRATVLQERLPWHVRYDSFVGTLPRIMGIRTQFIGAGIQIEGFGGLTCLYLTSAAEPAVAQFQVVGEGTITSRIKLQRAFRIRKFIGTSLCPLVFLEEAGQAVVKAGSENGVTGISVALI